jgi:SAM-dependent methyltransferase
VFSKRLIQPELLDHVDPEIARPNLADLVRINRYFGGHTVIRKTLAQVVQNQERFTLLDVGAASGDTALLIQHLYPRGSVTSLDYNGANLEAAPQPKVVANAFSVPFLPESFDYVLSSLFLHHFTDKDVVNLLRSFYSLAKRALLVCDLERHILPFCFLPITKPLFGWNYITVHDGKISVRASFRADELLRLSRMAGLESATVELHRPAFRISMVALKGGVAHGG